MKDVIAFEWDVGNINKSEKHRVDDKESEEVFFDTGKKMFPDVSHPVEETRYMLIGKTKSKRLLYVVFTYHDGFVRIISARDLNKREYYLYE